MPFYQFIDKLHKLSTGVTNDIHLVLVGSLTQRQRLQFHEMNEKLFGWWESLIDGNMSPYNLMQNMCSRVRSVIFIVYFISVTIAIDMYKTCTQAP